MKIGIQSSPYFSVYGREKGPEKMCEHGYEAVDYSALGNTQNALYAMSEPEFEQYLKQDRQRLEAAGIEIYQAHGPWRYPILDFTKEQRAERFEKMAKAVRGCAILGCPNLVIHNIMPYGSRDLSREVVWDINRDFMGRLAEIGKEYGVVINMENMPFLHQHLAASADLLDFVRSMNTEWIRVCLDTGHAAVWKQSPADCVRLFGTEYLRTLHVHDNDGKRDAHQNPYTGVIDWTAFTKALLEIGYEGVLSLETSAKVTEGEDRETAEKALAQTALKLAGR